MEYRMSISDYSSDWAIKDKNIDERPGPGTKTREEIIQAYGNLEIDGVELFHDYWEDYSTEELKRLCDESGLPVFSYTFFIDLALPASERGGNIDQVKRLLDRTAGLGAKFAMIVPIDFKDDVAVEQQRSWVIEGLRTCAEYSKTVDVTLLIENCDPPGVRQIIGKVRDCHDICREVDSPAFRLIYDSAATLILEEDPIQAVEDAGEYLVHFHAKNSRLVSPGENLARTRDSVSGRTYTGTLLEQGDVSIPDVTRKLLEVGYRGWFQPEYQGMDDPVEACRVNLDYIRNLLKELEKD